MHPSSASETVAAAIWIINELVFHTLSSTFVDYFVDECSRQLVLISITWSSSVASCICKISTITQHLCEIKINLTICFEVDS